MDAGGDFAARRDGGRWAAGALVGVLLLAALVRLYRIDAPLLDGMAVKQIYVAQKAQSIAGPPFSLARNTFALLQADGRPMELAEEIPLYTGLIAAAYRSFGRHEWFGRMFSLLATLAAVAALYDLARREFGDSAALVAAWLFAWCPLLLFYGRAVQSDAAMLAAMLASICCYQRHLDRGGWRWLAATAVGGVTAAAFKYYGLMVLVPLAWITVRRRGGRSLISGEFALLAASLAAPIALWIAVAFLPAANPARNDAYFLFQAPELLIRRTLYTRFVDRFLYKDCGPVTAALLVAGVVWIVRRRAGRPALTGLTLMGLVFYFAMGPKIWHHNYYGLMLLPAASVWGALGWQVLFRPRAGDRLAWRPALGCGVLVTAAVVHSPWLMPGNYFCDTGYLVAAERLDALCSPGGRVVVAGPSGAPEAVHYSNRQGWTLVGPPQTDWFDELLRYRSLGAEYAAIYLNDELSPQCRTAYEGFLDALPVCERRAGRWSRRGAPCELYLVRLSDLPESLAERRRRHAK